MLSVLAVLAAVLLLLLVILGAWSFWDMTLAAIDRATTLPEQPRGRHRA